MELLEGIKLYELVLLILGCILFMALIAALIVYLVKGKNVTSLSFSFLIPIIMIGFPSIQSISFSQDKAEIQLKTEQLTENPGDSAVAKSLAAELEQLDYDRVQSSPDAMVAVAKAQSALGNYDTALTIVNKALEADDQNKKAREAKENIKKKIDRENNFKNHIEELNRKLKVIESTPGRIDSASVSSITTTLSTMETPVYVDNQSALVLAKAFAIVNEKKKATETINKVLEARPQSDEALNLKRAIEENSLPTMQLPPHQRRAIDNSQIMKANTTDKLILRPEPAK